ncbi:hypothetical protein GCM10011391_15100 [Pullulanibacillus camelliae]|uniref:Uncharacterized protein n=1 Tax=Pullulanibacillus camelliae TaxID=1707096 RepID=A0A8J2VRY4_9BACL|nr:hypothetical protein GCM10011391_15100 [Pullulanibacillus camelliae]
MEGGLPATAPYILAWRAKLPELSLKATKTEVKPSIAANSVLRFTKY